MRIYAISVISTLVLTAPLAGHTTTCERGGMQRQVNVAYDEPGQPVPCQVVYTKSAASASSPDTSSTPWRAQNESGYCEARASELVANLEQWGWDCGTTADDMAEDDMAEPEAVESSEEPDSLDAMPIEEAGSEEADSLDTPLEE